MRLLFVCTGNVCRSPVAERLVRAWAGPHAPVEISSAGVSAVVGSPMDARAAAALVRLGGDPAGFRARPLPAALDPEPDLVLTMTRKHRTEVLRQLPRGLRRTFTLLEAASLLEPADLRGLPPGAGAERARELGLRLDAARGLRRSGEQDDVLDPIGMSGSVHRQVAGRIAEALHPLADVLLDRPANGAAPTLGAGLDAVAQRA